jgi:hypothetical protein
MANYNLQPNESIILKNENVYYGKTSGELILTNLNLVFITTKGMLKKKYVTKKYPVNQIKVFNEKAQVMLGKEGKIDIYFMNGQESFRFWNEAMLFSGRKAGNEAAGLAEAINQLLTGNTFDYKTSKSNAVPGVGFIAESLKDTFDTAKEALGIQSNSNEAIEKIAAKCSFCGAQLSGIAGSIVRCQYCDAEQRL